MQFFCLFISNIWQFSVILKKSASRLPATIFETLFGLDSWRGSQLTTNTKKVTHPALRGKCLGEKCIFSKFEKIRFFSFYAKTFAKSIFRVYHSTKAKNPKKSIFLIKALSTFCGISFNILNCHEFFPLHFHSKIGSIL